MVVMADADKIGAKAAAQVDFATTRVIELGQERLRAMQAASIAIDQRISQVAAFQLAAAAFAGSLLISDKVAPFTVALAFGACLAFVAGAVLAFRGTAAGKQHLPGLPPSYWKDAPTTKGFDAICAQEWLAMETEGAITFNKAQDEKQAWWLHASLWAGLIGAALVAGAAGSRLAAGATATSQSLTPAKPSADLLTPGRLALLDQAAVLPPAARERTDYVRLYFPMDIKSADDLPFTTMVDAPISSRRGLVGVYVVPGRGHIAGPPGTRLVNSVGALPSLFHGGCMVVNVVIDIENGKTLGSWCNVDESLTTPFREGEPGRPSGPNHARRGGGDIGVGEDDVRAAARGGDGRAAYRAGRGDVAAGVGGAA